MIRNFRHCFIIICESGLMPPKTLVAIVAVAILAVGLGVVVTWGYVHHDPDGYYDYDISYAESFETSAGAEIKPSAGKMFVIADIVLMNSGFDAGINTSMAILTWQFTIDRMTFDADPVATVAHPDYSNGLILNKGRTWGYTVVFEIPEESVGKRDASLGYAYTSLDDKPALVYDPELRLKIF